MGEKSVLVVDDSSLARMMIRTMIVQSFADWKVVEAKNSDEALAHLEQAIPDLALIDYNMPGMNGLELAATLQAKYPNLSLQLVTANIQEKMRQRADALGIGFIMKPISLEKLSSLLT